MRRQRAVEGFDSAAHGDTRAIGFGSNEAIMLRGIFLVVSLAAASSAFAGAPTNAAHDLAQKFAGAAEPAIPATTNAVAAQPQHAKSPDAAPAKPASTAPAKSAIAPQQPVNVKPFAKTATDTPVAKVTISERPPLDYEMDMLRRARAEDADRKAAEQPATKPPARIVVTPPAVTPTAAGTAPAAAAVKSEAVAPKAATEPVSPAKIVGPAKPTPSTQPTPTAAPIKAEPQKIVEAPAAATTTAATPPAAAAVTAPAVAAPAPPAGPTVQASVLLAIETGGASSRSDATALDPIICVGDSCFLSAGLIADAVKLSKSDALKLKSSDNASPDACRGKVGCVFRNVGLTKNALIEVIEIGGASAAPARTYAAEPDATCKTSDGALACENPIATADFRLWIVPEATAKTAGAEAIEDAVADSLPHRDIARDTDK